MEVGPENSSKSSIPDDDDLDFVLQLEDDNIEECNEEFKEGDDSLAPESNNSEIKNDTFQSNSLTESKEIVSKLDDTEELAETEKVVDMEAAVETENVTNAEKVIVMEPQDEEEDLSCNVDSIEIKVEKLDSLYTANECSNVSDSVSSVTTLVKVENTDDIEDVNDVKTASEATSIDIEETVIKHENNVTQLESEPTCELINTTEDKIKSEPNLPESNILIQSNNESVKEQNSKPVVTNFEESSDLDSVDKELDSLLGLDNDDLQEMEIADNNKLIENSTNENEVQSNKTEEPIVNGIHDEEMFLSEETNVNYDCISEHSCDSRSTELLHNEHDSQLDNDNEVKSGKSIKRCADIEDTKESSLGSKAKKIKTAHADEEESSSKEVKDVFKPSDNGFDESNLTTAGEISSDLDGDADENPPSVSTGVAEDNIPSTASTNKCHPGFIEHTVSREEINALMAKRDKLVAMYFTGESKYEIEGDVLDEVVILKVAEYLGYTSDFAKYREKGRFMEKELLRQMKVITSLKKQLEDAKYIIKKLIDDKILAKQQDCKSPVLPLKVTRSVGLQVCTVGPVTMTRAKEREGVRHLLKEAEAVKTNTTKPSANVVSVTGNQMQVATSSDANNTDKNDDITFVSEQPAPTDSSAGRKAIESNDSRRIPPPKPPPISKGPTIPNGPTTEKPGNSISKNNASTQPVSATIDLTDYEDEPTSQAQAQAQNGQALKKNPSTVKPSPKLLPTENGTASPLPVKNGPIVREDSSTRESTTKPPNTVRKTLVSPPISAFNNYNQLPKFPASVKYPTNVIKPPRPVLRIGRNNSGKQGIMLSWNFDNKISYNVANITEYQLYACQEQTEGDQSRIDPWKKVGNIKALPLPMACFLTQFVEGHKYHFIVRAVDKNKIIGEFSLPGSIILHSAGDVGSSIRSTLT